MYSTLLTSQIQQTYANVERVPVEIQYVFPVDSESVIYNLTIQTSDNKTIVGEIMENGKAKEVYDKAIKEGNTAYMAYYDTDKAQDKVVLMIGNLQPEVTVTVIFTVSTQVKPSIIGDWRIIIPAALTPKFPTELAYNQATKYNLTSATYFNVMSKVPYNIDFTLNITSLSPLKNIRSSTHEIVYSPQGDTGAFISLNSLKAYQPDRDMIILFQNEDQNKPRVMLAKESSFYSLMLSFYPSIASSSNTFQEFILILDRSGSMQGQRIELAKRTCILFVQSIPLGSYFNIISFGSTYQKVWDRSVLYGDQTQKHAIEQIQGFQADLGGTEILQPLQEIYSWGIGEVPKTIFLITDGAVSNPDAVVQLIAQNQESMGIRVHAFGIGAGVSTYLINSAAEAGKGTANFVQENEPIDEKVVQAMEIALQPYLTNFNITWTIQTQTNQSYGVENSKLIQAPKFIKYLLNQEIAFVYGLIMDNSFDKGYLSISFMQGKLQQTFTMEVTQQQAIDAPDISKLTARSLIRELEKNVTQNREMIIYLSTKFNVLSSLTSFIAVQEVYDPVNQTMVKRNIPISATYDYGDQESMLGGSRQQNFGGKGQQYSPASTFAMAMNSFADTSNSYNSASNSTQQKDQQNNQEYMGLVQLQLADGSFQLNQELASALGMQLNTLIQEIPQLISSRSNKNIIWATTLALAQLEVKYSDKESSWRLVARKGSSWLDNNGLSSDELKQIKDSAKIVLSNHKRI